MVKVTKGKKKAAAIQKVVEEPQVEEKGAEAIVEKKSGKKAKKRAAVESEQKAVKKTKKEEPKEEEPVEEEDDDEEQEQSGSEVDDEEIGDEEEDDDLDDEEEDESRQKEMMEDDTEEFMTTDVEAFPIQEDDKEGIINLLTQIFLRNGDVDVPGLTDAIIAQKPSVGHVIGPAEDEADDENTNMVYAMTSVIEIDPTKGDDTPKHARTLVNFITERLNKYALKDVLKQFDDILNTRVGFLINERMLHFPTSVVAPSFSSLKNELFNVKKAYKHVLYIQKIRVADQETVEAAPGPSKSESGKKKKKGKAEKKRQAVAALANAEIIYDNIEDAELLKLKDGVAYSFDYPVHNDVEAGSKFHIIEKDGKKFRPYRRAVIMDAKRFNSFVDKLASFSG